MLIKQFYDKELSHASYAVIDNNKMVVIDPSRNPNQYYELAAQHGASIVYVLETHPHADFVSSHLQIHEDTGATILINSLVDAKYPHHPFDNGQSVALDAVTIECLHTPGHSPDSNSYLVTDSVTKEVALFSGDFLFIGDVGRPDLRESAGSIKEAREKLARSMYHSLQSRLSNLPDATTIYPTHGAGSLCGKNLSNNLSDTLGNQRKTNWALQPQSEMDFIDQIIADQPFIPKYFSATVEQNRIGADSLERVLSEIIFINQDELVSNTVIIDTRSSQEYKKGTVQGAINIPAGERDKFETWLGTIVGPDEKFYLFASSKENAFKVIERIAKIGYEKNIEGVCLSLKYPTNPNITTPVVEEIKNNEETYTIIDTRQKVEHSEFPIFKSAINIPLSELKERVNEISISKPFLIHCAGGYRSAIASSIIRSFNPSISIVDLGMDVKNIT